jgi:hypothetical protein
MPPRIIRNSDRPRASDRTMITTQTALALAKSLRLDWHCRHRRGNQTKGKPSRAKSLSKSGDARPDSGLDTETQVLSSSGRGRSFFLTSLFIALIDCISVGVDRMQRKVVAQITFSRRRSWSWSVSVYTAAFLAGRVLNGRDCHVIGPWTDS